ncbi:MAG TPA: phage regulatory CII family protein [Frateuria sp.]|uniref:phage regulatory CII family protein n=1 Tax=Frateuria sp. TaxID=2211372 RepID=UPI002D7F4C11|nr:phage regulatory CII family protein [Frateuria sp.]HET6807210.1 phage regulatory CII family protein [Frateuria sp.]
MNVIDAARLTAQNYPGGAEALALRMGMTGALLRAKLNSSDRNRLYAEDVELMIDTSEDHRIIRELAATHGYTLQPIDRAPAADDASVLDLVLDVGKSGGELSRVICEALADGVITKNEMAAISRASHEDQSAVLRLVARLCEMARREPAP